MMANIPVPNSVEMAGWIVCLVAFVVGVNHILKFTDRFKAQPPGAELKQQTEFLSQRIAEVEAEVSEAAKRDHANRREIYERMRTDMGALQQHVGMVDRKVGALESATGLLNQRMIQMDGKIDRLMERTKG